ncbi:glutamate carboxypeptidase II [Coccidioides immitis RS]|uniref:Glutamate carboxypeptidase II n=2 Tax=Coccidioides immitis TaxID=5501 RepID=J3KJ80_COCIM|nr:glutamate carboxypeptidase II [Coccidioides immitis RS]EAS36089.3 glutamate carboxypeptidase II [Coccidioides immitis RS]
MYVKTLSLLALSLPFTVEGCGKDHIQRRDFDLNHPYLTKRGRPHHPPRLTTHESILLNSFDSASISGWSHYYTHGAHLAGKNRTMAQWTADKWAEYGLESSVVPYTVYLNYPESHSLSLSLANGTEWKASLEEAVLPEDDTLSYPNRIPTFHGYSASGEVTAEYVYVGRGQQVDFERLVELGVELEGKIAIARYGGPFRGLKVKNAQDYGMIGCVIFTDPGDDGNVTEANGYAAYPHGPARNPTSVQRGSVQFLSTYPGDPTTPGYPSKPDSPRQDKSSVVPKIPSLPISWLEAVPILAALDGHGVSGEEVGRPKWVGGLNVTYSTGPAPGTKLSLKNVMSDAITPIWNAVGIINGTSPGEVVVIGNHRDAWIVGGAADPNSGSAVMIELAKAFGELQKIGWKPKRTIVLCSWDAEEYGLLGSVEWVEEYLPWLKATTVAYLNVDIATSGPLPSFDATPQLHELGMDSMKKVPYSLKGSQGTSLYDVWKVVNGEIGVLGSGSDYTAFVHNGIASADIGAFGGPSDAIYHYHSNFDSYHWMVNFGDPGFKTHLAVGQFLGLMAYHLASDKVVPFDITNYPKQMNIYLDNLKALAKESNVKLKLSKLEFSIKAFSKAARLLTAAKKVARLTNDKRLLNMVNHKQRDFERAFVGQGGLPNREFYKHVIFAPGLDTGYAPTTFPGVTEALQFGGNQELAQEWVDKTTKAIFAAAKILTPIKW